MLAQRSYIVCVTPRSGSTLLCEALTIAGAGRPDEHFLQWPPSGPATVEAMDLPSVLEAGTANGVFGVKVMWEHVEPILSVLDAGAARDRSLKLFESLLPQLSWVHIARNDVLGQAVSSAKAIRSGSWKDEQVSSPTRIRRSRSGFWRSSDFDPSIRTGG
jgi:LPS sulfotransferase NodH